MVFCAMLKCTKPANGQKETENNYNDGNRKKPFRRIAHESRNRLTFFQRGPLNNIHKIKMFSKTIRNIDQ